MITYLERIKWISSNCEKHELAFDIWNKLSKLDESMPDIKKGSLINKPVSISIYLLDIFQYTIFGTPNLLLWNNNSISWCVFDENPLSVMITKNKASISLDFIVELIIDFVKNENPDKISLLVKGGKNAKMSLIIDT